MSRPLSLSIFVAALLWFIMFNPWMGLQPYFWVLMACSSAILIFLALKFGEIRLKFDVKQIVLGLIIAVALWCVFWVGDKFSQLLFDFSRPQVDSIYGLGEGTSLWRVGLQLLLLTGPAEEIFWRGYIQKRFSEKNGAFVGMLITLAIYTMIHIWSFNFMLVMASMVAGAAWGFLYYLKPSWLPALVLSHAVWDSAVFAVFPI